MRDVHSDINVVVALAAAVYSADNTPVSIDLQGYDAAELVLNIGAGGITFTGTNKVDIILRHGDQADQTTHTPVAADDVLGVTPTNGILRSLTAAHATPAAYRYGYKGNRRHLSLAVDFSGTHASGTPLAATLLRMAGTVNPQANQA